jgi:hypothetical protein
LIAEIRAQAATWSPNGLFTEVLTSSALIARRPGGAVKALGGARSLG